MIFEAGNIIYFDPFYFKNGNTAKPKYFIILKNLNGSTLIASLPTRKNSIPDKFEIKNGCIEIEAINLNCFVISKDTELTNCGKRFDFNTFIYGYQIDDYDIKVLTQIYPNNGTDYIIWGQIKMEIFHELINCFKYSKAVKRRFKKML